MATSHPEPAEQGFEIVDVDVEDHNLCNRGALSESNGNGNAHRHRPNTLAFAFALPTSFRSPSNHGQGNEEEDDDDDDDDEEEDAFAFAGTTGEPASPTRTFTFIHLPFTKIKTPQKANMTSIFILSLLCLLGGVGVAVHFVRRYSGDRTTVIAINKNLAFTAVGGYDYVQVLNAENKGGECWDKHQQNF